MDDHTIARWLTDRAELAPDRVAIDFAGRMISYADLASAAWRRAAAFAACGLRPGDRVATLARNCPEQVEVFFACALSGLIMVPLNWRLATPEVASQLADADPAIVLAAPSLRAVAASASRGPVDDLAPMADLAAPAPSRIREGARVRNSDPLLIMYTSGTTGKAKGAVLTHENCYWTNVSLDQVAPVGADDVVLQVLPQCHVAGWNVQPLLAWRKGATVVLEQSFDAGRVLGLIGRRRVTTMMGVPASYLMLAEHPSFAGADLSSLRRVIVGGAAMPVPLIEKWLARGVTIMQGYGLTEAAPNVLCVPAADATRKAGSAGLPYPHVEVKLRDGTGELMVRGPNVFAGYWRDPPATSAAFSDGWLATGDVADRDTDGYYWIRGRIKDMYISGGENVYPAEVEQVLAAHEAVAEAAVIGIPDARWGETGVAFVVPRAGRLPDQEELRAYCRTRLAGYKVPARITLVTELPRLTSGKVDKRALRQHRWNAAESGAPGPGT